MGQIRKQAIFSSIVTYIGFLIGFVNTYFFIKEGTFTPEQYGLTRLIMDIGTTFASFATLGVLSYIYRFFPYYKAHLRNEHNDQFAWSVTISLFGFLVVAIVSIAFEPFIIRKFSARSPLLVDYFYWILPYTFGLLMFTLLESFAWYNHKSVTSNLMRETGVRIFQSILIAFFLFKWIQFDMFVKLFTFSFIVVALILFISLRSSTKLPLHFKVSKVTRRLSGRMVPYMMFIYGSQLIATVAQYIDSIFIAGLSPKGLADAGVYTLATFISNTIQVPQRSIVAATIPVLAASWRNKNYNEIKRIYSRSSINLLLLSLIIFFIIWLNIDDFFDLLNINDDYEAGKTVILILGISKIIDAGTGVNSQIIVTSRLWKFDVLTSIVLLFLTIPLNYFLVKNIGINGSAIANLVSFTVYNALRLYFIRKKFSMQPFTWRTLYSLIIAISIYFICQYLFVNMHGWAGIFLRSSVFALLMVAAIFGFKLTPDAHQLAVLTHEKLQPFIKKRK
jgi:O-antigen/teichoic acid export membrane protein